MNGVDELLAGPTVLGRDAPVGLSSAVGMWPAIPAEGAVPAPSGCAAGVVDFGSAGALGVAADGVVELLSGPAVAGKDALVGFCCAMGTWPALPAEGAAWVTFGCTDGEMDLRSAGALGVSADAVDELLAGPTVAGRDVPEGLSSAVGMWPTIPAEGAAWIPSGCADGMENFGSAGALGVAADGMDEPVAGPAVGGRDAPVGPSSAAGTWRTIPADGGV
jgi:hypothetical protein